MQDRKDSPSRQGVQNRKSAERDAFSKDLGLQSLQGNADLLNKTTLGLILFNNQVTNLLPGGPAFFSGLRKGDVILEVPHRDMWYAF
jgi:hypothetical protein